MDHELPMLVQWPAVSAYLVPALSCTLKPREQRAPPVVMASPPAMSLLNVPGVCLITRAPAFTPTSSLILAISAALTVLSTVRTTLSGFLSTYQAVPPTSAVRRESAGWLSAAALTVEGVGWADPVAAGVTIAGVAAIPVTTAISRARLVKLRG